MAYLWQAALLDTWATWFPAFVLPRRDFSASLFRKRKSRFFESRPRLRYLCKVGRLDGCMRLLIG